MSAPSLSYGANPSSGNHFVTVDVFAADEQGDHPVDTLRWARLAEAVLGEEGLTGDAELSVLFSDEGSIAELNSRFLGKEGPTDVLAFPIDEEPIESGRSPDSGGTGPGMPSEPEDMPVLLGDIVICPAVAYRNAPEHAGTYDDEVALLVVHGLLHLMGMDHQEDEEAEEMEAKERELLARHYAEIRPEAWKVKPAEDGHAGQAEGGQMESGRMRPGQASDGQISDGQISEGQISDGQTGDGQTGDGKAAGHRPSGPQAGTDGTAGSG
jgi:probable rRNA maturation factor